MNKSADEIKELAKTMREKNVRQMIRYYFSRHLLFTSKESQMKVSIIFQSDSNDMLHIVSIWQDPCEGYITFEFEGGKSVDFDDLSITELIRIINDFENYL